MNFVGYGIQVIIPKMKSESKSKRTDVVTVTYSTSRIAICFLFDLYKVCLSSFFKVTRWFLKWRSLNPWKGHFWVQRSLWRTWVFDFCLCMFCGWVVEVELWGNFPYFSSERSFDVGTHLNCNSSPQKKFNYYWTKMTTPWKSNIALENKPSQKERIVFQPSIFRGELLNFGGV